MNQDKEKQVARVFELLRDMEQSSAAYRLALQVLQRIIQEQAYQVDIRALLIELQRAASELEEKL